ASPDRIPHLVTDNRLRNRNATGSHQRRFFRFFRSDSNRLGVAIAHDGQSDIAILLLVNRARYIARGFHLLTIDSRDHVTSFQSCLRGGTVFVDGSYQQPAFFYPEVICELFCQRLGADTDAAPAPKRKDKRAILAGI